MRQWHDEEGWGVLVSPEIEGDVFAHFSSIRDVVGYRSLTEGQTVHFTWEHYPALRDGCPHRAIEVYTTADGQPLPAPTGPAGAFESSLTIEWDEPPRS